MKVLKKMKLVVQCPVCGSTMIVDKNDLVKNFFNYYGVECAVCRGWIDLQNPKKADFYKAFASFIED